VVKEKVELRELLESVAATQWKRKDLFSDSFNLRGPYLDMKSLLSGILLILVVPLLLFTSAAAPSRRKTLQSRKRGSDLSHWDSKKTSCGSQRRV